jgi:hypothetical protein
MPDSPGPLVFNGINAATGDYLLPASSVRPQPLPGGAADRRREDWPGVHYRSRSG